MSNYYQDPLEILNSVLKATNQKEKDYLIQKAMNMYKHPQFEVNQNRNTISNTISNYNNIKYQYNVCGAPSNPPVIMGGWGPNMCHMTGSSPPAP